MNVYFQSISVKVINQIKIIFSIIIKVIIYYDL